MGTKYLARTAIEGGRRSSQRDEEHEWTKSARVHWNQYCNQIRFDQELADSWQPDDRKCDWHKEFDDKLTPIYRWLQSRVGRPWAEVRHEIKTRFDIRTTAGRHIVYDHLIDRIKGAGSKEMSGYDSDDWRIDENGILRGLYWKFNNQRKHRKRRNPIKRKAVRRRRWTNDQIWMFFRGRQVTKVDGIWHWNDPYFDDSCAWEPCVGPCAHPEVEHRKRLIEPASTVYPPARGWRERQQERLRQYGGKVDSYLGAGQKTWQKPYWRKEHRSPHYRLGAKLNFTECRKLETLPYSQQVEYVGYKWNRWT